MKTLRVLVVGLAAVLVGAGVAAPPPGRGHRLRPPGAAGRSRRPALTQRPEGAADAGMRTRDHMFTTKSAAPAS